MDSFKFYMNAYFTPDVMPVLEVERWTGDNPCGVLIIWAVSDDNEDMKNWWSVMEENIKFFLGMSENILT